MENLFNTPETTFSRRILTLDPFSRSLARVCSYAFLIIVCGVIVSCLISDVIRLKWLAFLLILMVVDWALHAHKAHYSLYQFLHGHVPSNNIALCLNRRALSYLVRAYEKTRTLGGSFYASLILTIGDRPDIARALKRLDIEPKEFYQRLEVEYHTSIQGNIAHNDINEIVKELIKHAAHIAYTHGRDDISDHALFIAASYAPDHVVEKVLDMCGITAQDIEQAITQGEFLFSKRFSIPRAIGGFLSRTTKKRTHRVNRSMTSRPTPLADEVTRDITDEARRGDIGFLVGHQREYARMVSILARETKRNVILIGDPGIGKETIVHRLGSDIIHDKVPAAIFDSRVIELSIGALLVHGDKDLATQKLTALVDEIIRAGNIIVYIPDLHVLFKASKQGEVSLVDIIAPIIKSDSFPIIGATYPKEFKEYCEHDPLFEEQYETVRVEEITHDEAQTILTYEAIVLEKRFGVTINVSAIKQAVLLAAKYLRTKKLPSSAQELLREVVADATYKKKHIVTGADIIIAVEKKVQVPIHQASGGEAQQLLNLEKTIHQRYIDQEEAVEAVANALRAYRSGLARKGGPMASFLFVGPTGVGKTELSKLLAEAAFGSEKMMIRFDMSEYQTKESTARFIGSPDGAIAGALTESVMQKPYALILFDEFEKAHPDVLNLFLQVLDDGRLTDGLGRTVDFQNTIIIATSNAHSVYVQECVGNAMPINEIAITLKKKLTEYFRPELLNRFSDVVVFKPLSEEDIKKVAFLSIEKLIHTLRETHGVTLVLDDDAITYCARQGYDPAFGARPLRKVLDTYIVAPLSTMILSNRLTKGQKIFGHIVDNRLVLEAQ
ncbi:MAG: ATP-dependent Clp protease ATP-binding subunit [Candidatus Pacebacteria bacterium]|nr:ATP-dependent Clp protease ATP-binding subunit [Candidatus Paceibacterota bacterium]